MTEVSSRVPARTAISGGAPWRVVIQGAAALAVGMGVGRFVYTPILPLMEHQAGLSASMGSDLATANYVAGTFLVAAISQNSPGWLGSGAWVLVGLAATPASAMWVYLAHRRPRSTLLLCALLIQVIGIALPSLSGGIAPALISAVLFGNTFVAISSMALAIGAHLQFPRSVALLTAGYSIGQILGPLVVKPLLHDGYHDALLVGALIVLAASVAAIALRVRFPHRVGAMVEPSMMGREP